MRGRTATANPDGTTPPFRLSGPKNTARLVETLSELTRSASP